MIRKAKVKKTVSAAPLFEDRKKGADFIFKFFKSFPKGEIYLVGGAVRDHIMGRETKDFDFVVRGVGAKNLEKFLDALGDVDLVGRNFGVFKFLPKGSSNEPFDIALPRREHSTGDGGYRNFSVQSNPKLPISEDLSRRDFTVNAIAYKLKIFGKKIDIDEIVDLHGGQSDIKNKIIRTVGKPEERFSEDYSRMLRALRFSAQLGFKIGSETFSALRALMSKINDKKNGERVTPTETIAKEFLKAIISDPVRTFDLWDSSGAFRELMPELLPMRGCGQPKNFHSEGDVWTHTRLALSMLSSKEFKKLFGKFAPSAETVLGVLFHDIGKPPTKQTPEEHGTDRIRFNNHDTLGAKMTEEICHRLTLSAPADFAVDAERLAGIVRYHLITVHGPVKELRASTIEKYFFNPAFPGEALQRVIFCDSSATIPEKGKPDLKHFFELRRRIANLKKISEKKPVLPPPLLDGIKIMKLLNLNPSPKIGEILAILREEQLSGRLKTAAQARNFLFRKKKELI